MTLGIVKEVISEFRRLASANIYIHNSDENFVPKHSDSSSASQLPGPNSTSLYNLLFNLLQTHHRLQPSAILATLTHPVTLNTPFSPARLLQTFQQPINLEAAFQVLTQGKPASRNHSECVTLLPNLLFVVFSIPTTSEVESTEDRLQLLDLAEAHVS
jgi:hypothetical protein